MSFEDLKKYQPAVVKLLDNSFKKVKILIKIAVQTP